MGVPDIAGHSSSLDILHAVGGPARNVVISDCATGYIWTYPLAGGSQEDFEAVIKMHYAAVENRRTWVPHSSLLKEIFIGCPAGTVSTPARDDRLLARKIRFYLVHCGGSAAWYLSCLKQVPWLGNLPSVRLNIYIAVS